MAENETLDELDKKLTPEFLTKRYKAELFKKIIAGETSLANEIEKVITLEKKLNAPPTPEEEEEATGFPAESRIKRPYTLSPEALEARRKNAQKSTGPVTEEGKRRASRNSWRHGLYASSFMMQIGQPCKSTCPKFGTCSVVNEGGVSPGDECLDKQHLLEAGMAISKALREKDLDDLKDLVAVELAGSLDILRRLKEDILAYGTIVKEKMVDKDGLLTGWKLKNNPSLIAFSKFCADMGLTFTDFLITTKSLDKANTDKEAPQTIADILSGITARAGKE